ncbi:universal stress protein [Haloterrigena alkaliphila]|uniref:HPP family protein n=1 Tax=Haloterrigena alkaliphila TaxID=2816475 RepID=A0A8A2V8P1_9EURY|nr:HPP family protein [Haloterrigena alkaliphila]QSW97801.1 HPP family protein [Haloterrigena alkaliphila]
MLESVRTRIRSLRRRLRRLERRELDAFSRWLEHTGNLLHLSVLVFVPLLLAAVTWLANVTAAVSFLLFPPLASGTYTLFADPEGRYSTPTKFVGGMTAGACCGWLALALADTAGLTGPGVSASGAALAILFTGIATWVLDLEEPTAFSTALLVLVSGNAQLAYVLGIVVSSSFVAAAFVVWRDRFYERRARYLYQTTNGDDHVLVSMDDDWDGDGDAAPVVHFAAELASAHDAGKIVLFDTVDDGDEIATSEPGPAARRLESFAADLAAEYGVPCEVVVAAGERSSGQVLRTAREHNCDLIVTPYAERDGGGLSPFIVGLFDSEIDVIAFRAANGRRRWRHAMVAVRGAGDTARAMVDFAKRVSGSWQPTSVCTCIDRESERRGAENTVADLVDAFDGRFETHVVTEPVESYLERVSPQYDVVFVGSSTDRSAASRFVSPPTFERLSDLEADVAIVHRGRHR